MKKHINQHDDERLGLAVVDEAQLERLNIIMGDEKLRIEFARDLKELGDPYWAYVLACPFVDVAEGNLKERFQRDFVGEAAKSWQADLLAGIHRFRRDVEQTTSNAELARVILRRPWKRGHHATCFVRVMSDERVFLFEHPHSEAA